MVANCEFEVKLQTEAPCEVTVLIRYELYAATFIYCIYGKPTVTLQSCLVVHN